MRYYTQVVAASLVATLAVVDSIVFADRGNKLRFLRQDGATVTRGGKGEERTGTAGSVESLTNLANLYFDSNLSSRVIKKMLEEHDGHQPVLAMIEKRFQERGAQKYMYLDEGLVTRETAEKKFIEWILEGKTKKQVKKEFGISSEPGNESAVELQESAIKAYGDWLEDLNGRSWDLENTAASKAFAYLYGKHVSRDWILGMFKAWATEGTPLKVAKNHLFKEPMRPFDMFQEENFVAYVTYAKMLREKIKSISPPRRDPVPTASN
uniref:Secreted RxLR effector protein 146 n=1 Tax=Plasmopara viticola TaxID=143451 RepID=RL146_PLAVT|nr:RecName: Full=Secreted RxLR effector protein 146; Flags: Precursor [Plasmopara viticola]